MRVGELDEARAQEREVGAQPVRVLVAGGEVLACQRPLDGLRDGVAVAGRARLVEVDPRQVDLAEADAEAEREGLQPRGGQARPAHEVAREPRVPRGDGPGVELGEPEPEERVAGLVGVSVGRHADGRHEAVERVAAAAYLVGQHRLHAGVRDGREPRVGVPAEVVVALEEEPVDAEDDGVGRERVVPGHRGARPVAHHDEGAAGEGVEVLELEVARLTAERDAAHGGHPRRVTWTDERVGNTP